MYKISLQLVQMLLRYFSGPEVKDLPGQIHPLRAMNV